MTTQLADNRYLLMLSPSTSLLRTTMASVLLVTVPVFGVLFFLGLKNGTWPLAVAGMALTLLACAIGVKQFRSIFIGVTATTIEERGLFGSRTSTSLASAASVALVSIYSRGLPDPVNQLIVSDAEGRRLLRMRGSYWTLDAMRSVIASIDLTPSLPTDVMTRKEFFTAFPGAAYWFDRRPALFWSIIAGVALIGALLLIELVKLAGLHFGAS